MKLIAFMTLLLLLPMALAAETFQYGGSVFTVSTGSVTQNSTISSSSATSYNVTWRTIITFTNNYNVTINANHSYSISSDFSPIRINVSNSTNHNITDLYISGNALNWTTENLPPNTAKDETVYWTCQDCVTRTDTRPSFTKQRYEENISLSSPLSSHTITIATLSDTVPQNTYEYLQHDLYVYENTTDITSQATVSTNTVGTTQYYSSISLSNIRLSSKYYEIIILPKPTSPGTPTGGDQGAGGGGGESLSTYCSKELQYCVTDLDCCADLLCRDRKCTRVNVTANVTYVYINETANATLGTFFAFDVLPTEIIADPLITSTMPNSTVCSKMVVYNMERNPDMFLKPMWAFACKSEKNCLIDWCSFQKMEDIDAIPSMGTGSYKICCDIPTDAYTEAACGEDDPDCNIYEGMIYIWPDGYDKNYTTLSVMLAIPVSSHSPIGSILTTGPIKFSLIFSGIWRMLNSVIWCLTKSCYGAAPLFTPIMSNPITFGGGMPLSIMNETITPKAGVIIFEGITILHIIIAMATVIGMWFAMRQTGVTVA